jgi:hypothetical protein
MSVAARAGKASAYRSKSAAIKTIRRDAGEKKGVDQLFSIASVINTTNTNGDSAALNLIAPGNGSYNRVGRKCFMKSLKLNLTFGFRTDPTPTTGDLFGNFVRCVVVWDKQPSGVLPTFDTIFGHTLQDGTEACQIVDPPRYDNMSRFQVLSDDIIDEPVRTQNLAGGSTDGVFQYKPYCKYIKLGNRETIYSGQSATCTIADISSGGLYVFWRAAYNSSGTDVNVGGTISMARLRYSE